MASTLTLLQLRTAVRQRSDMVNSTFISDAELNSYINQSAYELYDILVQAYGNDYYVHTVYTFTTDGTNDQFALPTDFYKLLGVDLALSTTQDSFVTVRPFNISDRNRYSVPNFQSFYGVTNLRYHLRGNNLWLTPIPAGGQTIRVLYVPRMTELASDSDTLDGISGWTEYVICDAAIKCMQKEESDTTILMTQKAGLIERINSAAENRDAANPHTVSDGQYTDMWWPTGSGSGSGGGAW